MHDTTSRAAQLTTSLTVSSPCLCLRVQGELDLHTADQLLEDGYPVRPDLTTVLVDVGDVTFCDSAGIKALLALSERERAYGRSVVVVRATPFIWRLMRLCGVTDRLTSLRPARTLAAAV